MYSLQSAFDTAVKGVIAQGRQGADGSGACRYRASGGLKCAIGMLIPDEKYSAYLDRAMVPARQLIALGVIQFEAGVDISLAATMLTSIQRVHDGAGENQSFKVLFAERARMVGQRYGLDTSAAQV